MTGSISAQKAGWMSTYANSIAKDISASNRAADIRWDDIRDICDQQTYSDLDSFRLDMLADMVAQRLGVIE